jgi:solute carrier family 25 protein 42
VTTMERMQCGAFAGLVAQTVTYPIEVCRRRMQTIGLVGSDTALRNLGTASTTGAAETTTAASAPPSMTATIRNLYLEQGIRGFFKGVTMNWMKGPIAFAISFTTFDAMKEIMESESERALRLPRRWTTIINEKK